MIIQSHHIFGHCFFELVSLQDTKSLTRNSHPAHFLGITGSMKAVLSNPTSEAKSKAKKQSKVYQLPQYSKHSKQTPVVLELALRLRMHSSV